MEKIIVTTDLPANDKVDMRYAIQIACLPGVALIFLHIHQVLRDSFWRYQQYRHNIDCRGEFNIKKFPAFAKGIYRSMSVDPLADLSLSAHQPLKASVEMPYHSYRYEYLMAEDPFKKDLGKRRDYPPGSRMVANGEIRDSLRKSKPSILPLFYTLEIAGINPNESLCYGQL